MPYGWEQCPSAPWSPCPLPWGAEPCPPPSGAQTFPHPPNSQSPRVWDNPTSLLYLEFWTKGYLKYQLMLLYAGSLSRVITSCILLSFSLPWFLPALLSLSLCSISATYQKMWKLWVKHYSKRTPDKNSHLWIQTFLNCHYVFWWFFSLWVLSL